MEKPAELSKIVVSKTLELARLIFAFGNTNRITCYEDGVTPESDTDHTVMLGIVACAYAREYAPHLDRGKIAEYALVHDLVEAYAGDTATFRIMTEEDKRGKEEREAAALARIREEFDAVYPWIGETIEEYESLTTPEARYVKVVDKVLPKLTHILNNGAVSKRLGHTQESKSEFLTHQYNKIAESYGADQQEALAFLKALHRAMEEADLEWGKAETV